MGTQNQKHQTLSKAYTHPGEACPRRDSYGGCKMGDYGGGSNDTVSCQLNNRDCFAQLSYEKIIKKYIFSSCYHSIK